MWATPLPGLVTITVNNTTVYPVWANGLALLLGIAARPFLAARRKRAPTREERDAEIRRRAQARARKYR